MFARFTGVDGLGLRSGFLVGTAGRFGFHGETILEGAFVAASTKLALYLVKALLIQLGSNAEISS